MIDKIARKNFPKLVPTRRNYLPRLVETVKENKEDIMRSFRKQSQKFKEFDKKKKCTHELLAGINTCEFNFYWVFLISFSF